jgi:hypothetical protein
MESKDYLVYIKEDNGGFSTETTKFEPHKAYRCMELSDGDQSEMLVYGVVFSKEAFNDLFENAHTRIMRHFEKIGLLVNGKPISKTAFIEKAFDVKYGNGKGSFWTLLFYNHPKEIMYRFSPKWAGGSKAVVMTNFYNSFIDLVNGDTTEIDEDLIEFGNCGLPLGRFRELEKRFDAYALV